MMLDNGGLYDNMSAKLSRNAHPTVEEAENVAELDTVPGWRLHPRKGNRRGFSRSLTVTRNYRLTFRVEGLTIGEIDFEDYH